MMEKLAGTDIAYIGGDKVVLASVQDALDLVATLNYELGCRKVIVEKAAIDERFFDLSTRLAGEVLQKFINYHMKMAIVGDFSSYTSKALRDFIYESNQGQDFFFVATVQQARERLGA